MNGQPGSTPEHEIIDQILKDGEAQAKRVTDNARRSEQSELRRAEAEAKKVTDQILAQAEAKARAVRSKEVASAYIEAKRISLRAREQAITKVFVVIEQEIAKLKEDPRTYKEALLGLAAEAVLAVGQDEVGLRVGTRDKALVDDAFLTEVNRRVEADRADPVKVVLELDPEIEGGGCVAMSSDGRIVFDNTFRRRLERMKPELRAIVVKEVLKTDV
jgi:vacuolar-type H+-ATPase subunit E/Vma4